MNASAYKHVMEADEVAAKLKQISILRLVLVGALASCSDLADRLSGGMLATARRIAGVR